MCIDWINFTIFAPLRKYFNNILPFCKIGYSVVAI